jgi:hypothetical protein
VSRVNGEFGKKKLDDCFSYLSFIRRSGHQMRIVNGVLRETVGDETTMGSVEGDSIDACFILLGKRSQSRLTCYN